MPILPSPLRLENLEGHPQSSVGWGVDSLQVGSGLRRGRRKEDLTQEEIFAGLIMAPHDTFIFRAPLPLPPESFQDLEFPMNRYFAGHAVVARLVDTDFEVVDPCLRHYFPSSGLREWTRTRGGTAGASQGGEKILPVHVGHLPLEYC